MEFRIINLNDSDWDYIVNMAVQHDFHHTSCYHILELKKFEVARLFVLESGLNFIALPLIITPIFNTSYFDARSVYGYGGPIFSRNVSVEMFDIFKMEFIRYCEINSIVSVFSRLHPQIDSSIFFENFGTLRFVGEIVFIDLTEAPEKQRSHYSSSNKNQINKLRRDNFTVEILDNSEIKNVAEFIDIYNENMKLVEANENYYFSIDYINKFLNNLCFEKLLLAVRKDSKICCVGIFTVVNGIMQYHLSGTKNEYRMFRPMKLLLDEARLLANDRNLHTFNLGGGYTVNDSLFEFKKSFSKFTQNYYVWNYIVNNEIYKQLVDQLTNYDNIKSDYFPLYRKIK